MAKTHLQDIGVLRRRRERGRAKQIYNSSRWRRLRTRILASTPLCVRCGGIASHVDHIVDIQSGGKPYARENLQPMCASCHGKKTAGAA